MPSGGFCFNCKASLINFLNTVGDKSLLITGAELKTNAVKVSINKNEK